MPFEQSGPIRYYSFENLSSAGVLNAVITRRGGVSAAPWRSLNVGATVGDDPEHVVENRVRSLRAFAREMDSVFDVWQVHGVDVVCAENPRPADAKHRKADIILTDRPHVTLFMRFADCVPILLYDPIRKVAGLAHAGWQGTVLQAGAHAVAAMTRCYQSVPGDILAAIGPSIGPHHYEVGPEVIEQVEQAYGDRADELLLSVNGRRPHEKAYLDLWRANLITLQRAGVRQIESAGICTACNLDDWYSHRAEKGRTGRFGALIAI